MPGAVSFEATFDQLTARVQTCGAQSALAVVESLAKALVVAVPVYTHGTSKQDYAPRRLTVGAVSRVISAAMARHPGDCTGVQLRGCAAILVAAQRLRLKDVARKLCVAGVTAPEAVLSALTRHMDNLQLCMTAVRALTVLCASAEGVSPVAGLRVIRCGGLGAVAACLGNHHMGVAVRAER